jgi:hypothetical protein
MKEANPPIARHRGEITRRGCGRDAAIRRNAI